MHPKGGIQVRAKHYRHLSLGPIEDGVKGQVVDSGLCPKEPSKAWQTKDELGQQERVGVSQAGARVPVDCRSKQLLLLLLSQGRGASSADRVGNA